MFELIDSIKRHLVDNQDSTLSDIIELLENDGVIGGVEHEIGVNENELFLFLEVMEWSQSGRNGFIIRSKEVEESGAIFLDLAFKSLEFTLCINKDMSFNLDFCDELTECIAIFIGENLGVTVREYIRKRSANALLLSANALDNSLTCRDLELYVALIDKLRAF